MMSVTAFIPALPVGKCGNNAPSTTFARPAVCTHKTHRGVHGVSARMSWRQRIVTAITIAGSLIGGVSPAIAAPPSSTEKSPVELRYDGRQELDGTEKAMSLVLTGGTFAALSVWAWKRNREDDELEQVRIREEVERLEKLKAEFMDVEEDDDSIDDEDLLAELNKRLSKDAEEAKDDDDTDNDDTDNSTGTDVNSETSSGNTPPTASVDPGANERPPSPSPSDDTRASPSSESVDILRRMWDATDDDSKNDESKPTK